MCPHPVQIWIADVTYADGGTEHYQVPLVLRREVSDQLAHAFVGSIIDADEGRPVEVYDALHDKEVTGLWLDAIAAQTTVDGIGFVRVADAAEIPVGRPASP